MADDSLLFGGRRLACLTAANRDDFVSGGSLSALRHVEVHLALARQMSNLLLLLQAFLAPLISPLELLLDALSQALTRFLSENGVLLTDLLDVSDV